MKKILYALILLNLSSYYSLANFNNKENNEIRFNDNDIHNTFSDDLPEEMTEEELKEVLEFDRQQLDEIIKEYLNSNNDNKVLDDRDKVIEFAKERLGIPYVWGGNGPKSFDCSGFMNYIFKQTFNISLPRTSYEMSKYKKRINRKDLKKGDLLFFETTKKKRITHVGLYIGDNKFIHASSAAKKVIISSLNSQFYNRTFRWGIDPFEK